MGVILAFIVLFLVFGSFFAAILPIVSALFALGTAIGVIGMLTHVLKMPSISPILVLLIGLGVGVDYALFIVTRHRQGLVAGQPIETSIVNAVNTSGRAVMFAGIIVCIALLGMFALGVSFLYGLAVSAAIGVLFTMISALTLLPAMLGFIGPKVMSRKQKRSLAENGPTHRRGRHHRVLAPLGRSDPAPSGLFGGGGVARHRGDRPPVLLPAAGLVRTRAATRPGPTTRTAYDLLAKGFGPGLQRTAPAGLRGFDPGREGRDQPRGDRGGVSSPMWPTVADPVYIPSKTGTDSEVAFLNVFPKTAPQDAATTDLIYQLRNDTIPEAVGDSGVKILVGGDTAIFVDFAHVLSSKLPLFIALVVILSFILLAIVFRSFVIPLTAAVMNLLSIGAAFGILVAVYQWGDLDKLFGIDRTGPVESFIPVLLFAILFGLVDGLPGLPGQPHARGIPQVGRQPDRRAQRPGRYRQDDHRGGVDHDPGLRLVRPRRSGGHQGVRDRAGRRRPRRCGLDPHGRGPVTDDAAGQGQLVVPEEPGPDPAPALGRGGGPGDAPGGRRRRTPNWSDAGRGTVGTTRRSPRGRSCARGRARRARSGPCRRG